MTLALEPGMTWDHIRAVKAAAVTESERLRGGYSFAATCPHCGGRLVHQAGGAVTPRRATSLARCLDCEAHIGIVVTLVIDENHRPARPIAHGVDEANAQRCRRRNGRMCPDCVTAHTAYTRTRPKKPTTAGQLTLTEN